MTIVAGMVCEGGIVFGADTEESFGEWRLRVHKIPTLWKPPTMIAGACQNGSLMDAAVERIFLRLKQTNVASAEQFDKLLRDVMVGLYEREFRLYPQPDSTSMRLLVAATPDKAAKAEAWSIDSSVVRRMRPFEIAGSGELVRFIGEKLYVSGMSVESGVIAMVQVVSAAKKMISGVGGETYVHTLRDGGNFSIKNYRFSPEIEGLYDFVIEHARSLLLATGDESVTDEQYDEILNRFAQTLRTRRHEITRSAARKSGSEQ